MPSLMGKAKAQRKLMDNLENEFEKVHFVSFPLPKMQHKALTCMPWILVTGIFWYRFKENIICQLETFQVWINLRRSWVVITLMILRSWSRKWFKLWTTCSAMTSQSYWKILGIYMTKIGKESSRRLEVVIPRRIAQGSNTFSFHYMSSKLIFGSCIIWLIFFF